MTKSLLFSSALALGLAVPAVASAEGSAQTAPAAAASGGASVNGAACPPGSWFCGSQAAAPPSSASGSSQTLQPLPDPDAAPPPPEGGPTVTYQPAPPPPPIVIYQPPPPSAAVRPEAPPPYTYGRRQPISRPREWGLNLHLEGATIGSGAHGNASMGGAGAGLRYKPVRSFGLEADVDFTGGHDYQGLHRDETAFTLNGLVFLNPRSRAQIYLLAGFGWSGAAVRPDGSSDSTHYSYFGAQAGAGLELRLSRNLAFNADFRGFVRSRTDNQAQSQPEFTDSNGRTTNTSGGGLLTGGMTVYF